MFGILSNVLDLGDWPSGKAPGFGPGIRGFESLIPSQLKSHSKEWLFNWLQSTKN